MKKATNPKNESGMLETDYPSIELAYPIAISSYDSMLKRVDALDAKIQNMMSFALAMFLVIPTIGNSNKISFQSWLFWLSIIFVLISFIISLIARKSGTVKLLDPQILFDSWLDLPQSEFKKDLIFYSGQDFAKVAELIDYKWKLNIYSLITFAAGLLLAVVWVAGVRF